MKFFGNEKIKQAILDKFDYIEENTAFGDYIKEFSLESNVEIHIKNEEETLEDEENFCKTLTEFRAYQKGSKIVLFDTRYETEESMLWKFFHELMHYIIGKDIFVYTAIDLLNQKYLLDNKIIQNNKQIYFAQSGFNEKYREDKVHENMPTEVICNNFATHIVGKDLSRPWWREKIKIIDGWSEMMEDTDIKFEQTKEKLEKLLIEEGLKLYENECTITDAVNYILEGNWGNNVYTEEDWINDTKQNYPQCFENYNKKLFCIGCKKIKEPEDVYANVKRLYINCEVLIESNEIKLEPTELFNEETEIFCNRCDSTVLFETQEEIDRILEK